MTDSNKPNIEIEGFGASYDRHMMYYHHQILAKELGLKKVFESPSFGVKAASTLYSLGFAKAGCEITVTDFDPKMYEYWKELGWQEQLKEHKVPSYDKTDIADNSFDMAWSFASFVNLPDKPAYMREMARVSRKYVMVVVCNNLQLGYPLHKAIHYFFKIPWNHGETHYNWIWNVKKLMIESGLKIFEYGTIDSPPWPDPVGFRDVRLHKKGMQKMEYDWVVPAVEYIKNDQFPTWMDILRMYDLPLRKGYYKLPFSHLFYVIGEKT